MFSKTTQETIQETTQETTPEITQETTPEITQETTPETTLEITPEITQETTQETTPEITQETIQETIQEMNPSKMNPSKMNPSKMNPSKCFFVNHSNVSDNSKDNIDKMLDNMSGNVGNTYITYCTMMLLFGYIPKINTNSGIDNIFKNSYKLNDVDTNIINNNYDVCLINMQDQLRREISYYGATDNAFKNINRFLLKINIPIFCFGLGSNCFESNNFTNIINELYDSQKEFIKIISAKCSTFSIRGKYTKLIMDNLNITNYKMVGCPTYYLPTRKKIIYKQIINKIVLAGCASLLQSSLKSSQPIKQFHNIIFPNDCEVYYFCQDNQELSFINKLKINNVNIVFLTDFDEINNFFEDKHLTIGGRVHCSIISLNNGILPICYNSDSRATEMCELFKIPSHFNGHIDLNVTNIYDVIDFEKINENYEQLKPEHELFIETNINNVYPIQPIQMSNF